jgi:ankyrin repeat protein
VVKHLAVVDESLLSYSTVTQLFSNGLKPLKTRGDETRDDQSEHSNKVSLRNSPFDYAVSYWLKHAMVVPPGMNTTSRSKALWGLVKDFFWDNSGAAFVEWLRIFSPNREDWHCERSEENRSLCVRCLYDETYQSEVSSCLHVAASYGLLDILDWAHPEGLNFDIKSREGRTSLMFAAYVGELDAAKAILSKDGTHVDLSVCESSDCNVEHDFVAGTALTYAILGERFEVIELLLKQPSIDVDYLCHGTTALGRAIDNKYWKGARLLVSAGANLAVYEGETLQIPDTIVHNSNNNIV